MKKLFPINNYKNKTDTGATFKAWFRLMPYLKPYVLHCILLLLLIVVENAGALSSPYFLKLIIDNGLIAKDYQYLISLVLILLVIVLVRVCSSYFSDYLYTWISNKITVNLMSKIFGHLTHLPLSYFQENTTGGIVYTLNNEINIVRRAFTGTVVSFVNHLVTLTILVIVMCSLNAELFLLILVIYPIIVFIMRHFSPKIKSIVRETRGMESDLLGFLTERIYNIKFIKLYSAFDKEFENLSDRIKNLVRSSLSATVYNSISKNFSNFVLAIIPLTVIFYGGNQVISDTMTLGSLIAFLQYSNKLNTPIIGLINIYSEMIRTSVSIERLFSLLDQPRQFDKSITDELEINVKNIHFREVYYRVNNKNIIKNCSFNLEVGKNYAIVGPSGGGKTTLINLLTKLTSPTAGEIMVDGYNLNQITFSSWMRKIAICSQEYFIINGTVLDNIKYGLTDRISDSQLAEVASVLGLSEIMNCDVGEQGSKLSGGQKHRVAIARGILRKPEIIVLDETTSEIDSEREEIILQYLFSKIRTVIVVSHRLASLGYVDEILFIEKGKLSAAGKFSDLKKDSLKFKNLFRII